MRLIALVCLALAITTTQLAAQQTTQLANPLKETQDSAQGQVGDVASYGLGYDIGMNIAGNGLIGEDITPSDILAGLLDALAGKDPTIKPELVQEAMKGLAKKVSDRRKAVTTKFLDENKKKEGVQVTESGLQYQVIKAGTGDSPTAQSKVSVHYEGKLVNGEIFDSSIQRREPATFGVTEVIPGWTEALLRMKVGDKWKLVIPSDLAYGEQGRPPVIGPNEALIFEVELLEVQ
ncbi:MAG: FKBP-type peptidyl-prolyl cis-trans isomerase [Aureliella sp.]